MSQIQSTSSKKPIRNNTDFDKSSLITIGEIARAYNVSLRTLRFYEDKGLIIPKRDGVTRYYSQDDKKRLELILKGKHLGFTLVEIRDMLSNQEKTGKAGQLALDLEQIASQIAHLEQQRSDIDGAIMELKVARSLILQGS